MGQRVIHYSDLSGKHIENDEDLVRIVITSHPDVEDGPVEIEALADELTDVEDTALELVTFELHYPDQDEPETVIMEKEPFDKLVTEGKMADVLKQAKRVSRRVPAQASAAKKINYATLEHAGKPKKGKTSDEEKKIVQENFDAINERLKSEGLRTIDLNDPAMVERYGLEELAKERAKAKK